MPTSPSSSIVRLRASAFDDVAVGLDRLDDLPAHAEVRMQARERVLEDQRDLGAADLPQLLGVDRQQVAALEQRLPGDVGALRQPDDRLRRDALARARLADDAERLAALDLERDAAHGLHDTVGRAEGNRQIADVEQRHLATGTDVREIHRSGARPQVPARPRAEACLSIP